MLEGLSEVVGKIEIRMVFANFENYQKLKGTLYDAGRTGGVKDQTHFYRISDTVIDD